MNSLKPKRRDNKTITQNSANHHTHCLYFYEEMSIRRLSMLPARVSRALAPRGPLCFFPPVLEIIPLPEINKLRVAKYWIFIHYYPFCVTYY